MKSFWIVVVLFVFVSNIDAQDLINHRDKVEETKKSIKNDLIAFNQNLVKEELYRAIDKLVSIADNPFKQYLVAGVLYEIEPTYSFNYHEKAFNSDTTNEDFIREYAIELHRKGEYAVAVKLYEKLVLKYPTEIRLRVWLADCYINIGNIEKSIDNWKNTNFQQKHVSVDFAINTIYSNANQLILRNKLRNEIQKGDFTKLSDLIYLDKNWQKDFWNKISQDIFLKEDLLLLSKVDSNTSKEIISYLAVQKLENKDSIINILERNKFLINSYPIPKNGKIASFLIEQCFIKGILSEKEFYNIRGNELLNLSKTLNDIDLLNIYAYLQVTALDKVLPEIDKLGWEKMNDERFAISYLIGKNNAQNLKVDDAELSKAIQDFPNSSKIFKFKNSAAFRQKLPMKPLLVELIKREFKSLETYQSKYSYSLNTYFKLLDAEK